MRRWQRAIIEVGDAKGRRERHRSASIRPFGEIRQGSETLDTPIPPLIDGDRLSRPEFERRFDAMPDLKKAELIEGVVCMDPIDGRWSFARLRAELIGGSGFYKMATPGLRASATASIRIDSTNMLQPDGFLFLRPECGGQSRVDEDGYLEGVPELVMEVIPITAGRDQSPKFDIYRRNGAKEYLVCGVEDRTLKRFPIDRTRRHP